MSNASPFSREETTLAHKLVKEQRLTMRQLQQGIEWSSRNGQSLLTFLNRFCSLELKPEEFGITEEKPGEPRRRLFERHNSNSVLWLEVNDRLVEVSAINISRGGLAFRCRWALDIDSIVLMGAEQQVPAVVRYCVDDGPEIATVGAEFAPRTIDDLQAIEDLMASMTTRLLGSQ